MRHKNQWNRKTTVRLQVKIWFESHFSPTKFHLHHNKHYRPHGAPESTPGIIQWDTSTNGIRRRLLDSRDDTKQLHSRINYNQANGKTICLVNYNKIKYTRLLKCRLPIRQYYRYYFSKNKCMGYNENYKNTNTKDYKVTQ